MKSQLKVGKNRNAIQTINKHGFNAPSQHVLLDVFLKTGPTYNNLDLLTPNSNNICHGLFMDHKQLTDQTNSFATCQTPTLLADLALRRAEASDFLCGFKGRLFVWASYFGFLELTFWWKTHVFLIFFFFSNSVLKSPFFSSQRFCKRLLGCMLCAGAQKTKQTGPNHGSRFGWCHFDIIQNHPEKKKKKQKQECFGLIPWWFYTNHHLEQVP